MAHDREAPGPTSQLLPTQRDDPAAGTDASAFDPRELTDERIHDCEARDWLEAAHQEFGSERDGVNSSSNSIPAIR